MQLELLNTLIFFVAGGFLVFLAITITRDDFTSRANRAAGMMLLFAGLGPLALAMGYVIQGADPEAAAFHGTTLYNLYYIWEFFFPALLVFSWVFPVDRLRHFKYPKLRFLILIPQIIHTVLVIFYDRIVSLLNLLADSGAGEGLVAVLLKPFGWIFSQILLLTALIRTNEEVVFGSVNFVYIVIAVYFLEVGQRYLTNPRLQTQAQMVVRGTRIGLGFYVLSYLVGVMWDGDASRIIGSYLLIVAIAGSGACFAYAIMRHQFLNVQLIFRQSMIYTFTSAVLVGAYVLLGMQSESFLAPLFGERAEVVSYFFILFILLLFQPISQWIDNIVRSMFVRTRTDYGNILERFSRQVISIFEPLHLRQAIEETLKTAMLVNNVYFVLFDDSVEEYAILQSDDHPRRTVIDREDLMLRGINLLDTPTRYSALADFLEDSRLAEILTERRVQVILPMKDAQHMLGFLALTSKAAGYRYTSDDFNLLGVLSNQMVTAMTNARLYADSLEKARLEEEVNMARQIQLDLLPSQPPTLPCTVICADSTPSRTVGGDFYDFIPLCRKDRTGIVIADASGKGMPAALMVAQIQAIIRSEVNNGNPIPLVMKNMNQQMATSTSPEKYVTLFYAELDQNSGLLEYANAGHNYPLLVRADGEVERLIVGGPIIGAFPDIEYESATVQLQEDDLLFLFTDGLSEAMNPSGVEYGEDRIKQFVVKNRIESPETILTSILGDVRDHDPTSPPQDDTTLIALKMIEREKLHE
ncbi:MAG: hypothetical protein DRP45_07830 [Candidatus Zixiibacteriota bacterium]|nr:MAG: hypothetical protein DRP45_07830 [candidate division Zixibacteria bacterium]